MSLSSDKIIINTKLQYLAVTLSAWFVVKLFYPFSNGWLYYLLGDLAGILSGYIIIASIGKFKLLKSYTPISRVVSIGIAGLFLLIIFNTYSFVIPAQEAKAADKSHLLMVLDFLFAVFALSLGSFIIVMMMELYHLKSRQARRTYYNAMLVFLTLSCLTAFLNRPEYDSLKFINLAFTVNAFILMAFNSFRMAWIAFLNKTDKRRLILFSILMAFLFGVLAGKLNDDSGAVISLTGFSYGLKYFLMFVNIYCLIYFSVLFFTAFFHLPTAEAIDRKTKEFSSFQYLSKLINQVLDFKELGITITDLALEISGSDAAWLIMTNDPTSTPVAPKNIGYLDADRYNKLIVSGGWDKNGVEMKFHNLIKTTSEIKPGEKYLHAVTVPLRSHNKVNAVLVIVRKANFAFDQEDRSAIDTFADYASIAIENSRLLKESIEKERLEKELDVAREMQRKLIPAELPKLPQLDISAVFIPAFEVGGDYYDFFEMSNGRLGFVVGDVSGKGISAAFIMAELRGVFESLSRLITDPREILVNANDILRKSLENSSFVTVALGIYDPANSRVNLVRAGHTPILYYNGEGISDLRPGGIGLGLNYTNIFSNSLEASELTVKENDILVVFTDGITEAKNSRLEDFGMERLKNIISEYKDSSADEITHRIINEVTLHSEANSQHDDITLVIIKMKKF